MTDRPIIFSGPMVKALLEGRKSMTRRLAWRKDPVWGDARPIVGSERDYMLPTVWQRAQPGDRLWVKETFYHYREKCKESSSGFVDWVHYRATDEGDFNPGMKWKPSIFMPRVHSRLTLVITATKIERLQTITTLDALSEGVFKWPMGSVNGAPLWHFMPPATGVEEVHLGCTSPVNAFAWLWQSLHGKESWEANPECVCLSFKVHKQNIYAMEKAA